MVRQKHFFKYKTKGADYHYRQVDKFNFSSFNAFVLAKYQIQLRLFSKILQKYFRKNDCLKILDIGCGDGTFLYLLTQQLKNNKFSLFGQDLSLKALRVARLKNPCTEFIQGDINYLKFPDDTFDIISSSDVIEHLQNPNKMLKETHRVLKKNGFAIIGTPVRFTEKSQDKYHVHEFYPEELKKLLSKYFISVKIIYSHPLIHFLIYQTSLKIFNKNFYPFKVLFNLLTIIFNANVFSKIYTQNHSRSKYKAYAYMFAICQEKR